MSETPQACSVFIVEDNINMREALISALGTSENLVLAGACDCVLTAIHWLKMNQTDVLLVDLGLPDGSGIEIIRACKVYQPQCSIMVITILGDEMTVFSAIEAGASGYILKGSSALDITQTIRDLMAGGSPISPIIARKLLLRLNCQKTIPQTEKIIEGRSANEAGLTKREQDTLELIARGYTYAETAKLLSVSISTVRTHIRGIYGKLSVRSSTEAIFEASKLGIIP